MKKQVYCYLLTITAFILTLVSCKKDETIQNQGSANTLNSSINGEPYLKFESIATFNETISKLMAMSDSEYQKWKRNSGLKKSLYDQFLQIEATPGGNNIIDSNFFFYGKEDGLLRSKNGIPLDKVLNSKGIVQVGEYLLRYHNNNVFYLQASKSELQTNSFLDANLNLDKELSNFRADIKAERIKSFPKMKALMATTDPIIQPSSNQQFDYEIAAQRFDVDSKTRKFIRLHENYIVVPTGTDALGGTIWSCIYKFYIEFTQQRKQYFIWGTYGANTYLDYLSVETIDGTPGHGIMYAPGNVQIGNAIYPTSDGRFTYTKNFLADNDVYTVGFGAHPTYELYNSNGPTGPASTLLPNINNLKLYTARIKLNVHFQVGLHFYYQYYN
ncbi:hypothetical protein [Niabella sp.]|uniref:hypothetical protein n=1 Tax=Niabella sp. TaxID=1962976 RepID=UPI002628DFBE|nr:hypothetical protein [Niabella sp.]